MYDKIHAGKKKIVFFVQPFLNHRSKLLICFPQFLTDLFLKRQPALKRYDYY